MCFLSDEFRYESSGYDEASFRKVYHSSPLPKKFSGASSSSPLTVTQIVGGQSQQQQQQHTIESGPSFNESLERFRMATSSGGESDGELNIPGSAKTSVFRQQRQQQQSYSSTSTTNQSSSIQRSVQEQRTMITRNSQKSYHIE